MKGLSDCPEHGTAVSSSFRRLPVRFGASGYVVIYGFDGSEVFITRIRHMREAPGPENG
jgi:hypothetical protein